MKTLVLNILNEKKMAFKAFKREKKIFIRGEKMFKHRSHSVDNVVNITILNTIKLLFKRSH